MAVTTRAAPVAVRLTGWSEGEDGQELEAEIIFDTKKSEITIGVTVGIL